MGRVSSYSSLNGATLHANDILPVVDVSDTTASAEGTTKNVTVGEVFDWYFPDSFGVPRTDITLLTGYAAPFKGLSIDGTADTKEAIMFGYGNAGTQPSLGLGVLQTLTATNTTPDSSAVMRVWHDEGDDELRAYFDMYSGLGGTNSTSSIAIATDAPSTLTGGASSAIIQITTIDETNTNIGYLSLGTATNGLDKPTSYLYMSASNGSSNQSISLFTDPSFNDTDGTGMTITIDSSTQGAAVYPISIYDNNAVASVFWITPNGAAGFLEQADPAAPAANQGLLYVRDNGSGKSQLCVRFNTGAVQVVATEP